MSQKALAYGMARDRFDGNDVIRVRDRLADAVRRARYESQPTLIEIRCYRFRGHSMSDPGLYRTKEEVEEYKKQDCLYIAQQYLEKLGAEPKELEAIEESVEGRGGGRGEVRRREPGAAGRPARRVQLRRVVGPASPFKQRSLSRSQSMPVIQMREALNQAMSEEMERDENVFLMGEEVGYYNGAYKVSQGMLKRFGEKRVIDAPIAENGFAGLGIGAAMVGLRPIIEFMTWNFSPGGRRSADQQRRQDPADVRRAVQGARSCSAGPGGAAHQLGAQHSQALEHIWAQRARPEGRRPRRPRGRQGPAQGRHPRRQPHRLHRGRGGLQPTPARCPRANTPSRSGVGDIKREGSDCTIIAWSKMIKVAMAGAEALAAEGIEAEVLDPRTLRPLDEELIVQSVKKTGRVVILEEGWPFNGVGAEIAYRIQRRCFDDLDHPVERLTSLDVSAPYHREVEKSIRPTPEKTAALVKKVLYLE